MVAGVVVIVVSKRAMMAASRSSGIKPVFPSARTFPSGGRTRWWVVGQSFRCRWGGGACGGVLRVRPGGRCVAGEMGRVRMCGWRALARRCWAVVVNSDWPRNPRRPCRSMDWGVGVVASGETVRRTADRVRCQWLFGPRDHRWKKLTRRGRSVSRRVAGGTRARRGPRRGDSGKWACAFP